ncbi:MAG: sodium:solute symporter [Bacteroidales bacterium]|nr:sodium:solute symporter [Bacteroidales bacterium]
MNVGIWMLLLLMGYYGLLLLIAKWVGRQRGNDAFFTGNRNSPWYVVAIGMVGTSVSGVSFISVPGMVRENGFLYMQTVLGFFVGYILIANVLLPLYYRLNTASIYEYLEKRFGPRAYKTGAAYFLLAKSLGAAAKAYVIVLLLHTLLFQSWSIPFVVTTFLFVFLIWNYTRHSGIKTLVWTDAFQTIALVVSLVWIIVAFSKALGFNLSEAYTQIKASPFSQLVETTDWHSKQHVVKQFFSGIFIALVMTGLDQDMIQKNRTISTLRNSQKNMYWYGFGFIPLNLLFLSLGALMLLFAHQQGINLPATSDEILPMLATGGYLPMTATLLFALGIVSASFSSADSSLTAMTTSYCIDIAGKPNDERYRKWVHAGFSLLLVVLILGFRLVNHPSLIDAIYILVSYTYGPLLGLYAFGLLTKRKAKDRFIPWIALASPVFCFILQAALKHWFNYAMGYELLMLNGLFTFTGLLSTSKKAVYGD